MKKFIFRLLIGIVLVLAVGYGTYEVMNARGFQVFGELTDHVETDEKVVALTFDDGPTERVKDLLPLLEEYDVKATFFLVGNEIEQNLDEARMIIEEGHQVGNHSYSHQKMVFKRYSFYKNEVNLTNGMIREIGYKRDIDFRPPFGKKLVGLPYYLNQLDMETIMWDVEPDTYYTTPEDKVAYVNENVKPGSIILMHPMYGEIEESLTAIEGVIQTLSDKGYTFVTVDELKEKRRK
ncbi:polysaccharide deacetylase family protein [Thalassobacillus hwangdonensis]|uniref:Polysaccharide deacetylase family protein n=1 Tax=Thalassobacillus hwangdonensis TaxID=546108 RepID=A0ABW3L8G2_9BACI